MRTGTWWTAWKSTSELGYTTSRRWRRLSTPSSRCSYGDDVASMAWGVQNLMSTQVVDPIRVDWADGSVFVTPPGWWHSHHNESDSTAWVLPIQDAGLYTHQRTLDIRFADDEIALHRQGRIRGTAFNITNKQYLETVSSHQAALDAADADVPNFNYGL
jgi:hypothetical protein